MSDVNFNFTGKCFLVTGASSGIGKQIAIELAQAGAKVIAIARSEEKLNLLSQMFPDNITVIPSDISDIEKISDKVVSFTKTYGKLNGMVHAAGIDGLTPLKGYDENLALGIMQTSFWSGVKLLQFVSKNKISNDASSYIFFSSVASYKGEKGMFAYSAAKAAIKTSVKSFAKELSFKQHRVNTISPGRVKTPMTAENINEEVIQRHLLGEGEPENISGIVLFLLSDRAKWITGTDIVVDGGYLVN